MLAAEIRRGLAATTGAVDYSYSRPARRATAMGYAGDKPGTSQVILPSLRRPEPDVAVVCDTSGSMSADLLARVLTEVEGLFRTVGVRGRPGRVLSCDATVHAVQRVSSARQIELIGGGGTDMAAGIDAAVAVRRRPAIVVVLTDGLTPWPARPPRGTAVVVGLLGEHPPAAPAWARSVTIPLLRPGPVTPAFDGISPVTVDVACTDAVHQARFDEGRLRLLHHDVDAERAMAALGGDVPACMQLLQLWGAAVANVDAGEAGSIHRLGEHSGRVDHRRAPWAPPVLPFASRARPGATRPLMHAPLPAALEDVLAQAAVLECERRWDGVDLPGTSRRAAQRLLVSRVQEAVTESLRPYRSHRLGLRVSLSCRRRQRGRGVDRRDRRSGSPASRPGPASRLAGAGVADRRGHGRRSVRRRRGRGPPGRRRTCGRGAAMAPRRHRGASPGHPGPDRQAGTGGGLVAGRGHDRRCRHRSPVVVAPRRTLSAER